MVNCLDQNAVVNVLSDTEGNLKIIFDGHTDGEATLVIVKGKELSVLLEPLSGALRDQDLVILSASVDASEALFRITDQNGEKLHEDTFSDREKKIHRYLDTVLVFSSSPLVYGVEDSNKSKPIQPITQAFNSENVKYLRKTADEVFNAAKHLATLEQTIIEKVGQGTSEHDLKDLEIDRAKAAALLDRPLLQLEAMLALRRQPLEVKAPIEDERTEGADFKFQGGGATSTGPASGTGFEILLQGFNWDSSKSGDWYRKIASQAVDFAKAGFTSIWLAPPSDSVSQQGYLPRDLYNLNSKYGSEGDLRECISSLHQHGLKVLADIVINHRCAQYQGEDGKWNKFGGRLPWDSTAICCGDEFGGKGGPKRGDFYAAAPNIDHSNPNIRNDLINWLKFLRQSIGFDGWRFDFVKGYPGDILKQYIDATVPEMAVGEFWDTCEYTNSVLNYNQQNHRQRTINWVDSTGGTSSAFDFTTKGILQEAVGRKEYWRLRDPEGRPPGMMGLWPSRAFLFIDNHDTGSSLQHWPFPTHNLQEGYAYILTHPGTPVVFYDHFWDGNLKKHIQDLLQIRIRNGLHCRSKIKIYLAQDNVYSAVMDDKVAMKIGPGDWSPNHDQTLKATTPGKHWEISSSGHNYAVWEAN
eukprot:g5872.t1